MISIHTLQYQNLLQPAVLAVEVDADVARLLDHRVGHVQEVNGPDGDDDGHVDHHDDDGDNELTIIMTMTMMMAMMMMIKKGKHLLYLSSPNFPSSLEK